MERFSNFYAHSKTLHRIVHPILERLLRGDRTVWLPILVGPLKGMVLDLNLQWEREFLAANFETETVEVMQRVLKPGMTAYDIGAHVGYFTILMANQVGAQGRVIAFEPNPPIMARLQRNIERNRKRLHADISLQQRAVADEVGEIRFYKGGATSTGRLARIPENIPASDLFQVECVTLDMMVFERGLPKPDFIKLDVEYVEDRTLRGADRVLREHTPIIICEIHDIGAGERVWAQLTALHYRVYSVEQQTEWRSLADVTRGHIYATPVTT